LVLEQHNLGGGCHEDRRQIERRVRELPIREGEQRMKAIQGGLRSVVIAFAVTATIGAGCMARKDTISQAEKAETNRPERRLPLAGVAVDKVLVHDCVVHHDGQPFAPDERMKKILTEAAGVGDATARSSPGSARPGARGRLNHSLDRLVAPQSTGLGRTKSPVNV
jgi:hypothetical protein